MSGDEDKKQLGLKCGDCMHFKSFPNGKKLCCREGIRQFAKAPSSCFVPDISQVAFNTDQLASFISTLNTFSPKQLRICLAIIKQSCNLKANQAPIGTKVYICHGSDYLSNYLAAYILYYMKDGTVVISGSPHLNCKGKSFIGYVSQGSVILASNWDKKRAALIKASKIEDPYEPVVRLQSNIDNYEPDVPTIDSVPESWLSKTDENTKKRKDSFDKLAEFL